MEIQIEYWEIVSKTVITDTGFTYRSDKSEITRELVWEGTKEEIFKRFDKENNSLRYCNGSFYKFKNDTMQQEYIAWYKALDKNTKFNMFYGNGVVD
jgi:hypothetical protein